MVTAEQLLNMPDDGFRYDLVRGELRRMSLAGCRQSTVTMALSTPLYFHVVHNRLGPVLSAETGFQLAEQPDTVLGPDISFAEADTLDLSEVVAGFQIPLAEVFA